MRKWSLTEVSFSQGHMASERGSQFWKTKPSGTNYCWIVFSSRAKTPVVLFPGFGFGLQPLLSPLAFLSSSPLFHASYLTTLPKYSVLPQGFGACFSGLKCPFLQITIRMTGIRCNAMWSPWRHSDSFKKCTPFQHLSFPSPSLLFFTAFLNIWHAVHIPLLLPAFLH